MSTNYAFGPETVEALAAAFHKSWNFISNDAHFATAEATADDGGAFRFEVCLEAGRCIVRATR